MTEVDDELRNRIPAIMYFRFTPTIEQETEMLAVDNTVVVSYEESEDFMKSQRRMRNDVRWEGWDMIFFRPSPFAISRTDGAFRRGRWGVETRVSPSATTGAYEIPLKNVRYPK